MPWPSSRPSTETASKGDSVHLPRLTDKEEIALALLMWKAYRQQVDGAVLVIDKDGYEYEADKSASSITEQTIASGIRSINLATLAGVNKEFMDLMMVLPSTKISILWEDNEPWERSKLTAACSIPESRIEQGPEPSEPPVKRKRGRPPKKRD